MKRKRFLQLLESKLSSLDVEKREKIIKKYEKEIEDKVKSGIKETTVIKEYGDIELLANYIIAKENNSSKIIANVKQIFSIMKEKVVSVKDLVSSKIKEKKKNKVKEEHYQEVIEQVVEENIELKNKIRLVDLNLNLKNKIYGVLLSFALVVFLILFLISCIGFLDGTVFIGIVAIIACFLFSIYLAMNIWFKNIFNKDINYKRIFMLLIITLGIFASSCGLTIYHYYKFEEVSNIESYYAMTNEIKEFNLPKDESAKYYIDFNTNYKTNYRISYNDELDGTFKVEFNYYRNYYDLNFKTYKSSLYISLYNSFRNRLSTILEGFRDKVVFNNNEFERYVVTIYMNEKDRDRIVINN